MNNLSPQEEMIQLIANCISSNDFETEKKCLDIYTSSFGHDEFYTKYSSLLLQSIVPSVGLVCIYNNDEDTSSIFNDIMLHQPYENLNMACISSENFEQEFSEYISSTTDKYICFYDASHTYEKNRIPILVSMLENVPSANGIICTRNFIDSNGSLIAHPDFVYQDMLDDRVFDGKQLLTYSIANNINLYGNLSTILLSTDYIKTLLPLHFNDIPDSMRYVDFLYQLLYPAKIVYTYLPLVSTTLSLVSDDAALIKDYVQLLRYYQESNNFLQIPENTADFTGTSQHIPCQKDITFFYTDMGEYYNLKPIADEASMRGYHVTFTKDLYQSAEIGVYCQHVCHPENSRFSIILLHDLAQGHNRWPNLWELERWNKFDIGIVPGAFWADLWSQCACQYYANPRCGTYQLGYPKSDLVSSQDLLRRVAELREKFHMKYDFSILYAPSWENDGKEDDFITALASLNVNLLIKQAHWSDRYSHIIENIRQMRALHEGKYDNVYYIEPEESIMTALAMCDLVVSDESSVMAEGLMFGKMSIAVTDWLIPDTTPSRFAEVPMDYVIKCQKATLRNHVEQFLAAPESYDSIRQKGAKVFSNHGHCCSDIMNVIAYFTTDNPDISLSFLNKRLSSRYSICSMWN